MALHRPTRRFGEKQIIVRPVPMRLYGTVSESIVDGPGIRFVVFVQGCPHHCPGCHNPLSHDPSGGTLTDAAAVWETIQKYPHIDGITFSGGEPFTHAAALAEIGKAAREKGLNVMTYSGYTYEQLLEKAREDGDVKALLTVTNYLVDGPFLLAERDLTLRYRGSRNQRILDVTCYPNSEMASAAENL